MIVYRICNKDEINKIFLNKNFIGIGKEFSNDKSKNTFDYEPKTLYMHFFKSIESILYLNTSANRCICTYNIPDNLLKGYSGYGKYKDLFLFKDLGEIEEFAIPSHFLKFEYLENVTLLATDIDYEDLIDNDINNFTKRLYKK